MTHHIDLEARTMIARPGLALLVAMLAGTLAFEAPASSQEDLLADLRAEVAAITASAVHTSKEGRQGDGGPAYVKHSVTLVGGETTYELQYKSFLPPNQGLNRSKLNDGASGLGMLQPSVHGWYSNGFVGVTLSDATASASISDVCGEVNLIVDQGDTAAVDFAWALPTGRVTLRFFVIATRPELFLLVDAEPAGEDARLAVDFRCYPGGFTSPFDRWVHTSSNVLANAGPELAELRIDPSVDTWMVLADHWAGVTMRPMGPCSIAASPEGIASAGAQIKGNYSVIPFYTLAAGQTSALFAIREFPLVPWQEAADEVAATSQDALRDAREALASLPD